MPLGDLEQVVLLSLVRFDGTSHGAPIATEIAHRTGRHVSPGALYTVLDRLEEKGLVSSWIGEATPARGGRRRKMYRIEPEGARAVRDWYTGIQGMASGIGARLDRLAAGTG